MNTLTLSSQEIEDITHYKRAAEQLRELQAQGIPARLRPDNTVCVLRMYVTQLAGAAANAASPAPKRKSARQ